MVMNIKATSCTGTQFAGRVDLWVGAESDGSYECQLDVVAFHPIRRHLVYIEPTLDLLSCGTHTVNG